MHALLPVHPARRPSGKSVRATRSERIRPLPGDHLIGRPIESLTHAITIERSPADVWPWLVQMGAGSRAGWYSYDFLDNGRRPSAQRLVPELQKIDIGSVFPAMPGVTEGFVVLRFEPCRFLTLGWLSPTGIPLVTWTFALDETHPGQTRLLVRARGDRRHRLWLLPPWLTARVMRAVHFVMQRKQLIGIAERAERAPASGGDVERAAPGTKEAA